MIVHPFGRAKPYLFKVGVEARLRACFEIFLLRKAKKCHSVPSFLIIHERFFLNINELIQRGALGIENAVNTCKF